MIIQKLTWEKVGPMKPSGDDLEALAARWFNNYFNSGMLADYLNTILNGQGQRFAVINKPSQYGEIKFEVEPWPIDKSTLFNKYSFKQTPTPKFKK